MTKISPNQLKAMFNRSRRDSAMNQKNAQVDGWSNILTGLGVRGRDKNRATTFCMDRKFGVSELDQIYRSDGMSRRVVDLIAEEMVREGWEIENDDQKMIQVKLDELNINYIMMNMLRWARLYGGSLGVLGVADGRPLDQPLNMQAVRELKWIHVYDRFSVSSATGGIDQDMNSPNYGKPNMYLVTDSTTGTTFQVHHSRTIRCDWNELTPRWVRDNDTWADPIFQTIYEELKNYSSAFANVGVLMHDFVTTVLKIPGLANLLASDGCNAQVNNRANILNLARSNLNMIIVDGEEDVSKITTNVAGLSDLLDRFMLSLSAVTGIPITLLFGRAPAGLNATGESDIRNFYDMIKQKQEGKLKPMLEKVIQLIFKSKDGFYKGVEPDDWKITFVPLWQNTEEQEANIRRTTAETDAIYIDRGVLDPTEVAISRFGGSSWSMETEINLLDRKNGYSDLEQLELEKEVENTPDPYNDNPPALQ